MKWLVLVALPLGLGGCSAGSPVDSDAPRQIGMAAEDIGSVEILREADFLNETDFATKDEMIPDPFGPGVCCSRAALRAAHRVIHICRDDTGAEIRHQGDGGAEYYEKCASLICDGEPQKWPDHKWVAEVLWDIKQMKRNDCFVRITDAEYEGPERYKVNDVGWDKRGFVIRRVEVDKSAEGRANRDIDYLR